MELSLEAHRLSEKDEEFRTVLVLKSLSPKREKEGAFKKRSSEGCGMARGKRTCNQEQIFFVCDKLIHSYTPWNPTFCSFQDLCVGSFNAILH